MRKRGTKECEDRKENDIAAIMKEFTVNTLE